ncbi:MAG: DUF368 domain-containing protein [Defluviitaleaceae bacterium]|nr:DUF368 domain-containing protein [Defluviitaleaceae bacterium]
MQHLFLILTGLVLGAANIVPGISGATLAVIFRVYDRLIDSINSLFSETKKSLKFLIPVGIGMVIGILVVGTVLDGFFDRFSFQTSAFIAGLVAGGIPFLYVQATSQEKKRPIHFVTAIIACGVIIALVILMPERNGPAPYEFDMGMAITLFFGGMAAAAAMIVPGVSGAMVLMLFGLLPTVMHTISLVTAYLASPLDFGQLGPIIQIAIPLGLGILVGILVASKLIAFLLKRFFTITYFAIIGMVIGTIFAVFYNEDTYASIEYMTVWIMVFGLIAFVCGMVIALLFGRRPVEEKIEEKNTDEVQ